MKTRAFFRNTFLTAIVLVFLAALPAAAKSQTIEMTYHGKKNGTYMYTSYVDWGNKTTTAYHKIKLKKSGRLVIGGAKLSGTKVTKRPIKVTLMNSKKKVIQPAAGGTKVTMENDGLIFYGVKAGTYYIRVKNTARYMVYAGLEKFADRGGASKKKAYTLKKGKSATGIMAAGESYKKSDWFCIKPDTPSLYITTANYGNGVYFMELTGPRLEKASVYKIKGGTIQKVSMGNLDTSGTYYVRFYRKDTTANRRGSCLYEVVWE